MKKHEVDNLIISKNLSIIDAISELNKSGQQILLITNSINRLIGVLTDGDIRRAILSNIDLRSPVEKICNKKPKYVFEDTKNEAINLMQKYRISRIPIINKKHVPIGMLKLEDIISESKKTITAPVVIMAGGKGTRLQPITKIIPKALVPLNGMPMIETIINTFKDQGFNSFYLSINYKKEFIKSYFREISERIDYEFEYVEEEDFFGTAGSLSELKGKIKEDFFVSNCDILIKADYKSALDFHKENNFSLTIISALKKISVPYGVINMKKSEFSSLDEKPSFHLLVNTGIYILKPHLIDLIPRYHYFNMTDLINLLKKRNMKVGIFPVHSELVDVGTMNELRSYF